MADETEKLVSSSWKTWGIVAIIMLLICIVIIVFLLWLIYKNRAAVKQTLQNDASKMLSKWGDHIYKLGEDMKDKALQDQQKSQIQQNENVNLMNKPYVYQNSQIPQNENVNLMNIPQARQVPQIPQNENVNLMNIPQAQQGLQPQVQSGGKCNCISGGAVNSIKYLDKLLKK